MNEKVENLVLEQLRQLRAQNDRILEAMRAITVEVQATRHHVRGNELDIDAQRDLVASMQARLDRIERRLQLVDHTE